MRIRSRSGKRSRELALEPLRARADPRQLGRAARRAVLERRLDGRAVVAVQAAVPVQDERDVAVPAAAGRAAGAAVDRRRDAAAVQQQDRLAAVAGDRVEPGDERRRQRVARLAAQVDDLDGRQRGGDPAAELEPLQRRPALGAGRRRAVDRDGMLERSPLRGDGSCVVARVGLLLVGGVVLLVDADHAEARDGREDRGARADDDAGVAEGDPLALVAPLGLAERRVQDGDCVAEARGEAGERLRRQRDLGHEHDCAAAAREGVLAGAEVDLGLAAAGRAVEQEVAAARVEGDGDALDRGRLRGRRGRRFRGRRCERLARDGRGPLGAALADVRVRRGRAPGPRKSRSSRRSRVRGRPARAAGSRRRRRCRRGRSPGAPRPPWTRPRRAASLRRSGRPRPCPCPRHPGRRT